MNKMGENSERNKDEEGMLVYLIASTKAKVRRIASKIYGEWEYYEGVEVYQRAAINRNKAISGRDRVKDKRICDRLEEADGRRDSIIDDLQRIRRDEDDLNKMIEDIGVCE